MPIFPYERYHFLYCPICEYGVKLDSDQVNTLKPIAKLNQQLLDGHITQAEYTQGLQDLSGVATNNNTSTVNQVRKKTKTQGSYFDSLHSKK